MTESIESVTTRLAAWMADKGMMPAGSAYTSVEAVVAAHGRLWTPQRRPNPWTAKHAYRQCFGNAGWLAHANPELTYCEGFARGASGFTVLHAWTVQANGGVVDSTWRQAVTEHAEYFGVAFTTSFLRSWIERWGTWGILGSGNPEALGALLYNGLPEGALACTSAS